MSATIIYLLSVNSLNVDYTNRSHLYNKQSYTPEYILYLSRRPVSFILTCRVSCLLTISSCTVNSINIHIDSIKKNVC